MSDLISRKATIDAISAVFPVDQNKSEYASGIACGAALALTYIKQLPSAQPERKKGKWLVDEDGNMECPFCGNTCGFGNYCNECGADLRGIDND